LDGAPSETRTRTPYDTGF